MELDIRKRAQDEEEAVEIRVHSGTTLRRRIKSIDTAWRHSQRGFEGLRICKAFRLPISGNLMQND